MATKQEPQRWLGRHPVIDEADHQDLEARAAAFEFRHGLPRDAAEHQAHAAYVKEKALDAATFHLLGIRAAHGAGNDAAAERHGHAYAGALAAAGHDALGPVPKEVLDRVRTGDHQVYSFKAHPADTLYEPVGTEADAEDTQLRGFLEKLQDLRAQAARPTMQKMQNTVEPGGHTVSFRHKRGGALKNVFVTAENHVEASAKAKAYLLAHGHTVGPEGWREYGYSAPAGEKSTSKPAG